MPKRIKESINIVCKKHGDTSHYTDNSGRIRCRSCRNEAVDKRRKILKLKSIEYKGGSCSRCQYSKCIEALEFHHVDPSQKDFSLSSTGVTRSWDSIKKELDKCILVCSNCHREIHFGQRNKAQYSLTPTDDPNIIVHKEGRVNKVCLTCNKEFSILNSASENRNYCSSKCFGYAARKAERPSKDELEKMVWELPTIQIAKKYNVSDKAIEKWCKGYGITKPPRGYWGRGTPKN
jgi:hypothetical protein